MSAVLYRKYRPRKFEEVVGQEHIIKTLKNAIKQGRIAHAYLFSGPRGTGKTTVARILAKAINCLHVKDSEPCNECGVCDEINQNKFLDLVEIDAATHTQVDKIRDIIEKINFSPSAGKYKVYIIDEVHMLSKGAFNALLKTLEEPPEHAIFVLATTEIHKIPPTITSRCQRFDFRRLRVSEIKERLERIAKEEKIKVEEGVLNFIAINSGGALRDSESLFGQIISLQDDNIITLKEAQTLLSVADISYAVKMIKFLLDKEFSQAISYINKAVEDGYDLEQFAKLIIEYCRKIMLLKISPGLKESFLSEMTEEQAAELEEISKKASMAQIVKIIRVFIRGKEEIKSSVVPQLPLEMAVAEIDISDSISLTERVVGDYNDKIKQPIKKITGKVSESIKQSQDFIKKSISFENLGGSEKENKDAKIESDSEEEILKNKERAKRENSKTAGVEVDEKSSDFSLDMVKDEWCNILESIKSYNHSLTAFLKTCQPVNVKGKEIIILCKYSFHKDKLGKTENRMILEKVASEILKTEIFAKFITQEEAEKMGYKIEKKQPSKSDGKEDNLVSSALDMFGGEVV